MGRRQYAYYRKPDGAPYHGTDGKCAPNHVLSEIGKTAFLNADGKVSWHGLDVPLRFEVVLRSAFVILDAHDVEVNENDAWDIVWKALLALVKSTPGKAVTPKELADKVNDGAAAFFRKPLGSYILVSSLSIADLPARQIKMRDCTISFLKKRGKRFLLPEALSTPTHKSAFVGHIKDTKYKVVRASVLGRSVYEAADRALNSLHLLRALWSLPATYGSWNIFHAGPARRPLGVIHIGPIHTLHLPDGKPASDGLYWYEPNYAGDQAIFSGPERWTQIEKGRRWMMRQLRHLPYRSELESLLIRYVRALDEPDMDVAFLQMWSILEKVTGTIGAKYDETIRKAIWAFAEEDQALAGDILGLLRCRRNQYVHSGKVSEVDDKTVYLIKSFVDPHLRLLLSNAWGIHNFDEYAEYLSLPAGRERLLEKKQMLMTAMKYHKA